MYDGIEFLPTAYYHSPVRRPASAPPAPIADLGIFLLIPMYRPLIVYDGMDHHSDLDSMSPRPFEGANDPEEQFSDESIYYTAEENLVSGESDFLSEDTDFLDFPPLVPSSGDRSDSGLRQVEEAWYNLFADFFEQRRIRTTDFEELEEFEVLEELGFEELIAELDDVREREWYRWRGNYVFQHLIWQFRLVAHLALWYACWRDGRIRAHVDLQARMLGRTFACDANLV